MQTSPPPKKSKKLQLQLPAPAEGDVAVAAQEILEGAAGEAEDEDKAAVSGNGTPPKVNNNHHQRPGPETGVNGTQTDHQTKLATTTGSGAKLPGGAVPVLHARGVTILRHLKTNNENIRLTHMTLY